MELKLAFEFAARLVDDAKFLILLVILDLLQLSAWVVVLACDRASGAENRLREVAALRLDDAADWLALNLWKNFTVGVSSSSSATAML